MKNPPADHYLAVWIWPRALPLGGIFGADWDNGDVRARFLTLTSQWHARHPTPSMNGADQADRPLPGQWMWHPPGHCIYDCHTYVEADDWLEVAIRIETADYYPGDCRVTGSLTVACHCEGGHGQHTIVETQWRSTGPAAVLDALTTVLRATDQWLAGSRHPQWWRRQAGLG